MKKIIVASALLLFAPVLVWAATFQAGDSTMVAADQNIQGNLYMAGGNVSVLREVKNGDLYAAGGNVLVQGDVTKDAGLAGGTVNVLGRIGDDLRIAGGNITIGSKIGGELLAAGGQVSFAPGAEVAGEAKIGGGNITLDGNFQQGIDVAGGTVTINGMIGKDAKIVATEKVIIGSKAVINGNLNYQAPAEAEIASGATIIGKADFQKMDVSRRAPSAKKAVGASFAFLSVWWFVKFAMLFVAALILSLVLGKKMDTLVNDTLADFGPKILFGLGMLILAPVILFFIFLTVVGIVPAIFGFLVYAALMILACVTEPILVGSWAYKKIYRREEYSINWKKILLGVFIFQVLRYVPFVGWLFDFILLLAVLGAWTHLVYRGLFKPQS